MCYGLAALAAGSLYVVVHERRRKHKKELKITRDAPISKELLLQILNKATESSKPVIDQVSVRAREADARLTQSISS